MLGMLLKHKVKKEEVPKELWAGHIESRWTKRILERRQRTVKEKRKRRQNINQLDTNWVATVQYKRRWKHMATYSAMAVFGWIDNSFKSNK